MRTRRTNLRVIKEVDFDGHRFEISISRKRPGALGGAYVTSDSDSDEYQPDSSETDSEDEMEEEHRLKRVKISTQTTRPPERDSDSEREGRSPKPRASNRSVTAPNKVQKRTNLHTTPRKTPTQVKRERSTSCSCEEHSSLKRSGRGKGGRPETAKMAKTARSSLSIPQVQLPLIKQERLQEDALSQARARSMELLADLHEVKQLLANADRLKGM